MGEVKTRATNTISLGGTTLVNRMGYGAMHLTGRGVWGPPVDSANAVRLLRCAVHELGIDFIDTADAYGPGDNEEIIRTALYPYPDNLIISTKGGMLRSGPNDWIHDAPGAPYIAPLGRPEYLRQQVELSLRRLGVERLGLYQLHSIDPQVPLADSLGELVRLRDQGKIQHIGLSNQPGVTIEQLDEAWRVCRIAAIENLYNCSDRTDDPVLQHAEMLGVSFIPWFPLGHGGLVSVNGPLAGIAADFGISAAQLALAWLMRRSPSTILIPGTTSIDHLKENCKAADIEFSDDDFSTVTTILEKMVFDVWRPPVKAR